MSKKIVLYKWKQQLTQASKEPNLECREELNEEVRKELNQECRVELNQELREKSNQKCRKESNQASKVKSNQALSSTNENNQTALNMTNQSRPTSDLTWNLGFHLKMDIELLLIKYLGLIRGQCFRMSTACRMTKLNEEVVRRLSLLTTGAIHKLINDSPEDQDSCTTNVGIFFGLDETNRLDIINLLLRDDNFTRFLPEWSENDKENLAKDNYQMVLLLDDLKVKDEPINIDRTETMNMVYQQNLFLKLIKLNMKVDEMKVVGSNFNTLAFDFEIKNVNNLLKTKKEICSENFLSMKLPWYLEVKFGMKFRGLEYLGFWLKLNDTDTPLKPPIKVVYNLVLFHPSNSALDRQRSNTCTFRYQTVEITGFSYYISHRKLVDYIKDDTINLAIKMVAFESTDTD